MPGIVIQSMISGNSALFQLITCRLAITRFDVEPNPMIVYHRCMTLLHTMKPSTGWLSLHVYISTLPELIWCFSGWESELAVCSSWLQTYWFTSHISIILCCLNRDGGDKQAISLTHRSRDKIAAIFQTTFLHACSWMKMYKFRIGFHRSLLLRA